MINTTTDDRYNIVNLPASSSRLETSIKTSGEFNGLYECIITNDAGSDNRSVYIELEGKT